MILHWIYSSNGVHPLSIFITACKIIIAQEDSIDFERARKWLEPITRSFLTITGYLNSNMNEEKHCSYIAMHYENFRD